MPENSHWFAIVDAAQDRNLVGAIKRCKTQECLITGDIVPALAAASPYLVLLDETEPLLPAWQKHGVGRSWGVLLESGLAFGDLRKRFSAALNRMLPDGRVVIARYYDPRVFNRWIRACTPEERAPWFDGVKQYAVEGEGGAMHYYRLRGGRLYDGDVALA